MHVARTQFLNDHRQRVSFSTQQTTTPIHHDIPPMYTSQFRAHPSSSAPDHTTTHVLCHLIPTQKCPHYIPSNKLLYNQQYQQQTSIRPPIQYTPIPQPNLITQTPNPNTKHLTLHSLNPLLHSTLMMSLILQFNTLNPTPLHNQHIHYPTLSSRMSNYLISLVFSFKISTVWIWFPIQHINIKICLPTHLHLPKTKS